MRTILKDKKGDFTGMLYAIVMLSAFAIFVLILAFIGSTIGTEVKDKINSDNEDVNASFDATINVSNNTLTAVWYVLFGGLIMGLMITSWYMPTHPVLVAPFIILLIIAVIVGVAMSNAYEMLSDVPQLSDAVDTQTNINFIMANLPYIALVIGIIALIITFAKPGGSEAVIG